MLGDETIRQIRMDKKNSKHDDDVGSGMGKTSSAVVGVMREWHENTKVSRINY